MHTKKTQKEKIRQKSKTYSKLAKFPHIKKKSHMGWYYGFEANIIYDNGENWKHGGDSFNDAYIKPYTRMGLYFIGVCIMFILLTIKNNKNLYQKFKLNQISYFILMVIFGFCGLGFIFWP